MPRGDWVRIREANGYETTISGAYAEGIEGLDIVDAPATNPRGVPLPATRRNGRRAKPRTTVKKAAAKKAAARSTTTGGVAADSSKEDTA